MTMTTTRITLEVKIYLTKTLRATHRLTQIAMITTTQDHRCRLYRLLQSNDDLRCYPGKKLSTPIT
eukprot:3447506-Ditylum_brightwellii.AAC.1